MQEDNELLKSFLYGDIQSMVTLIGRHESSLFSLCMKLTLNRTDAEDLYQQTWLKVINKPERCRRCFKNWIKTICINTYKDYYRKSKRRCIEVNGEQAEYAMALAADDMSAEKAAIRDISRKQIVSFINQLKDKHRITLILYYFEGLDYNECAQVLCVPVGTVKSRLNIAKTILRSKMGDIRHV